MTDPPEIELDIDTVILNGCPATLKKELKEPIVKVAPLCTSRGPIKLSYVDTMNERDCVQYIDRLWLVRDGCGNLANATQQIRIKRPEMRVTFPDDVRGKCHLGEVIFYVCTITMRRRLKCLVYVTLTLTHTFIFSPSYSDCITINCSTLAL